MSEFRCGAGKSIEIDSEDWNKLKEVEVPIQSGRLVGVTCPNCGSVNYHNTSKSHGHRTCDKRTDGEYECPGYTLVLN